jgi:ABC-type oligopeptide transport system substrate-binding subunit
VSNVDFRRPLACAIDREALTEHIPANLVEANGGIVPPALQGHTPDIVPRFHPDAAREHLRRSGLSMDELQSLEIAGIETWLDASLLVVAQTWKEVLGLDVPVRQASTLSAAVPDRQQDELRWVLRPRIRQADRTGSPGAERPLEA